MKILLFANTDWYLFNFRLALANALRSQGHDVVLVSPPGQYGARLAELGFRWVPFPLRRHGINLFYELSTLAKLARLYREERPDLVHNFTIKCVLYGSAAARLNRVGTIINSVTGLGDVFTREGIFARALRWLLTNFYRLILRGTEVVFQNPDDQRDFVAMGLVREHHNHLICGSGVDITRFRPDRREDRRPGGTVMFAGRLVYTKGVKEYVEAAGIARRDHPDAKFLIAGDLDETNPVGISGDTIKAWSKLGHVTFLGHVADMLSLYRESDIVVLPSYREGMPRVLLEAAACGLPLVAADVPGCREIVQHGVNGFLVPVRDSVALAEAIGRLLRDPDLRAEFGRQSRIMAEERFADDIVIRKTVEVYRRAANLSACRERD